MEREWETGDCS